MDPHERPLGMADGIALLRASAAVRVMAEGMDPLQAHDSDFNDLLGAHVKIVGLKANPSSMAWSVAACLGDENLGRAGVKLPGREQMLSVKASNLEKLAAPPVLDTDTEFNGQTEHSRGDLFAAARYSRQLARGGGRFGIAASLGRSARDTLLVCSAARHWRATAARPLDR